MKTMAAILSLFLPAASIHASLDKTDAELVDLYGEPVAGAKAAKKVFHQDGFEITTWTDTKTGKTNRFQVKRQDGRGIEGAKVIRWVQGELERFQMKERGGVLVFTGAGGRAATYGEDLVLDVKAAP